jgi:hypothetical protein
MTNGPSSELGHDDYGTHPKAPPSTNPIAAYFRTLKSLLTSPTTFFRTLKRPVGVATPLFFGVVTSWIGTALEYLWYTGFGRFFESRVADIMRALEKTSEIDSSGQTEAMLAMREKFVSWVFGVGSVLIDPFKTCAKILFLSFFVWIAARLFGRLTSQPDAETLEERFSYESAVTIVGFATAAAIFKGIPLVGGMIAAVFTIVISVIGAQETYKVGTGRALLIALFPSLLFWGLIFATIFAFLGGILMLFLR